jgi:hypothetical protein
VTALTELLLRVEQAIHAVETLSENVEKTTRKTGTVSEKPARPN